MEAAELEKQIDRVRRNEQDHPARIASEPNRAEVHAIEEAEAERQDHDLQLPIGDSQRQQCERVGERREQRAVRAFEVAPGREQVGRIAMFVGDHVGVRVQPMERPKPGVAEVVEEVRQLQRRAHQQDRQQRDEPEGSVGQSRSRYRAAEPILVQEDLNGPALH